MIIHLLSRMKESPPKVLSTPLLCYASKKGLPRIVQHLLEHHYSIDSEDHLGDTALTWSAKKCRLEIMTLALNHGANVHHENHEGKSAIDITYEYEQGPQCVLLLSHGATLPKNFLKNQKHMPLYTTVLDSWNKYEAIRLQQHVDETLQIKAIKLPPTIKIRM